MDIINWDERDTLDSEGNLLRKGVISDSTRLKIIEEKLEEILTELKEQRKSCDIPETIKSITEGL